MLTRLIPVPLGLVGIGGSVKEKAGNEWNRTLVVLKVGLSLIISRVVVDRYLILEVKPRQQTIYQDFWEISQYSISISNIDAVNKGQLRILPSDLHHPKAIAAVFIPQANYPGHTFLSGFVFSCFFVFCLLPPRHLVFGWNSFNIPGLVLTIRSKALDGSSTWFAEVK